MWKGEGGGGGAAGACGLHRRGKINYFCVWGVFFSVGEGLLQGDPCCMGLTSEEGRAQYHRASDSFELMTPKSLEPLASRPPPPHSGV